MEAGRLDRLITIERPVKTTDALGGVTKSWRSTGTVWAQVIQISDGERWRSQEVAAFVTTRFRIRWGADVTPEDRVVYDDRVYDIFGVKEIGRREGQEITASARAEV